MLVNNPVVVDYRHNYVRLAFIIGTLTLFIGHVAVNQMFEEGHNTLFPNATILAEHTVKNEAQPTRWVYTLLNAINTIWQFAWIIYTLTYLFRRSTTGYLYLEPSTLTPSFYVTYILGFLIQTVWLIFFHGYVNWAWLPYLASFVLLSVSLFILNNNLTLNRKIYETEGLNRDIWLLRFLTQNGVAFFACWAGVRFVLTLDVFLQRNLSFSIQNAGTVCLLIAFVIALGYFLGPNINAVYVEQCAYQFAPWIVFIVYFWGVVQHNWVPRQATRNNILAAIELIATLVMSIIAILLFVIRYSRSKIDRLV
ncbi:unnamed protein product [Didymodactylos carnosus]|uniref:Uncharacterized protein n=1 Tax=Didymodactylos carnosus TaxID=1234261 RepID=A0A8S2HNH4_9BILA|nr:unnamed protein product [Didymodactylos carnosus]CAF3662770.1 unnamed protein product [Didymodactylos carnosus]